ncbi:uncharacterized protein LOC133232973 isoform X2 [Bos javanicus]|uniref:uncharacterized protein LOC133232973 isoform X2 n=1 Tax=Bos javanicus TaxID=9906 RepID=UPI002AA831F2|nr:uncharacterized protein LOC133232973 isoform X2 [Bos javanicus]
MPAMTRLRRTELLLARESPGRTPGEQTGSCRSPWDLFIHLCLESELRESPGTKLGTDSSDSEQVLDTRRACGPPAPAGPLPELHGHEGGEEAGRPQGASQPLWRHQPSQALSVWTGFLPFPGPRHHGDAKTGFPPRPAPEPTHAETGRLLPHRRGSSGLTLVFRRTGLGEAHQQPRKGETVQPRENTSIPPNS